MTEGEFESFLTMGKGEEVWFERGVRVIKMTWNIMMRIYDTAAYYLKLGIYAVLTRDRIKPTKLESQTTQGVLIHQLDLMFMRFTANTVSKL
jgi:hypothetical protein